MVDYILEVIYVIDEDFTNIACIYTDTSYGPATYFRMENIINYICTKNTIPNIDFTNFIKSIVTEKMRRKKIHLKNIQMVNIQIYFHG